VSAAAAAAAAYPSRDDSLVDLDGLVGEERRVPGRHFVHQDTQRPPIHRFVVTFTEDDFGCQVFGCSAQRPRSALHSLGKSKVGHFQIALTVDEKVLGL